MSKHKKEGKGKGQNHKLPQNSTTMPPASLERTSSPVDDGHPIADEQLHKAKGRQFVNWDWWFAGIVALATAVQVIVGWCQWNAMNGQARLTEQANGAAQKAANAAENSNKIATETAKRDQRAYVNIVTDDNPKLERVDTPPSFGLELRMQNVGKTPAYDVVSFADLQLKPRSFTGAYQKPNELNGSRMTVGPNRIWTISMKRKLNPDEEAAYQNGTQSIVVLGRIEYEDVFGERHYADFQLRQMGKGNELLIEKNDCN